MSLEPRVCGDAPRIDDGSSKIDQGFEAAVCFACPDSDPLEFFEFAEKAFDQVSPLVHNITQRDGYGATRGLGDDDSGSLLDDIVAVECLVSKQRSELDAFDEGCDTDAI